MPRTKGGREDVVIRISKENHKRLRTLLRASHDTKSLSVNEYLERLLDGADMVTNAETVYLYNEQVYQSLEEARGEAVMDAARHRWDVKWPEVAIVIGQDSL